MTPAFAAPVAPEAASIDATERSPEAPSERRRLRPRRRTSAPGSRRQSPPPLSPRLALARTILVVLLVLAFGLLLQFTVVSSVQQRAQQQRLFDSFRAQLAEGTAPIGPVDLDGIVHPVGAPVAYLQIPDIGVRQVVVSGTSSSALFAGPGHRRDTVLPGQAGLSVFIGRRAAYGGPFGDIASLDEGDRIDITTGQGTFEYTVLGVRHEGDPLPVPPQQGESRLVLTTADGPPFLPNGVLRVDATMEGDASAGPGRIFSTDGLPSAEATMAGDTSQLWLLIFWLQALLVVTVAAVWSWHRWGRPQGWIVALPPLLFVGSLVADQVARLLPNML